VPVRAAGGALVAMIGYSGPSERLDREALVMPLKRAASALA
jgi:DNA-binding IclR family transcriptional regulator